MITAECTNSVLYNMLYGLVSYIQNIETAI